MQQVKEGKDPGEIGGVNINGGFLAKDIGEDTLTRYDYARSPQDENTQGFLGTFCQRTQESATRTAAVMDAESRTRMDHSALVWGL